MLAQPRAFAALFALTIGFGVFGRTPHRPVCTEPQSVTVEENASHVWGATTNGHTYAVTVTNTGFCNDSYNLSFTTSGPISGVSLSQTISPSLPPGGNTTVTATYNVGAVGTGVLTIKARGRILGSNGLSSDSAHDDVTIVPQYQVAVTPDGSTTPTRTSNTAYAEAFTVRNAGANTDVFTLSCSGTGITCGVISPAGPISLPNYNDQQTITVNYTAGGAGTGTLKLKASSANSSDSGSYNVPIVAYSVAVTPDGGTTPQRWTGNSYSETFTVRNTGGAQDTYTLTCTAVAPVTCAAVNPVVPSSVPLAASDSAHIIVYYSAGSPGTGQVQLNASGQASDQGYYSVPVAGGPPVVDASPYNFTKQDYTRCAQACFAATYAQSTVPYLSLDAARNITLSYNGDRVDPTTFVHVNVSPSPSYPGTPTEYRLQVKVNGVNVTFLNGEQILHFAYPGSSPTRLGGQFSVSSYATGRYPMDIVVSAVYTTGLFDQVVSSTLVVVNETNSAVARGWTIPGIQRLYSPDNVSALITEGDGSAVYFQQSWIPPAGEFSHLFLNTAPGPLGWTRIYPDSTKVVFDSLGRMSQVIDRFNNATTIVYDASGRVSQIKDPLNLTTTLTYDPSNGLDYITDPMGRVTQVTVDATRRLTLIQDPDNVGTTFGYDASNRLSTITDRRGRITTLGYDAQSGQLATITSPAVPVVNADGSETTASLVSTLESWKKKGVPYGITSPAVSAPLRDTVYARTTDPAGHVTRFTVNQWGTPAVVTSPINLTDSTFFDSNGLPIRTVYSTGSVDSVIYNSSGLPTYIKPSGLNGRNITYTGWAQVDSAWGSQVPSLKTFIGANGRVDSTRTWGAAGAAVTRFTYESHGRVDKITDPENHLAARTWYVGTNGNRSRDSLPGGRVTTYSYDTYGRRTSTVAPAVAVHVQSYDALNRVTRDSLAGLPAAVYAYDSLFLRSVTDPKGQVSSFAYNALGWLTARTDPANHADSLKYDRDGLLRRSKNRRGQVVDYTYDAGHRPLSKSGTNTDATSWAYSSNGRIGAATSPWAVDSQFFGITGMLDSVRTKLGGQTFVQRFLYTPAGLLDSVNIAGGGITFMARKYVWDTQRNVLSTIRLAGGETTSLEANRDGQFTARTFPIGDRLSVAHTSVHTEASISTDAAYFAAADQYLTFDLANRISRQISGDGLGGRDLFYDPWGRLWGDSTIIYQGPGNPCTAFPPPVIDDNGQTCTYSGTWVRTSGQAFSYDSVGNRRDQGGDYGPANRIRQFAGCTYVTDSLGDGNVLSRTCGTQVVRFYWSAESQLIAVRMVGGDSLDFRYDAAGRLVRRDLNGSAVSQFLWQGDNLLAELNGGATTKLAEYSYYPGLDNPHSLVLGTTAYFSHQGVTGNVIAVTDDSARLQRSYVYDAWGQLTGGTDSRPFSNADRSRFKGALWLGANVDLYYMRSRWYEPSTGRFLSEDPIGISGGPNLYTYSGGDPINGSDPTGTCSYYPVYTSGYADGHSDYVIQQTGADCSDEFVNAIGSIMGPGLGGAGGGGGFRSSPDAQQDPLVRKLSACREEGSNLVMSASIDLLTLGTGGIAEIGRAGRAAFEAGGIALRGAGRLALGARTAMLAGGGFAVEMSGQRALSVGLRDLVAGGDRFATSLLADPSAQGLRTSYVAMSNVAQSTSWLDVSFGLIPGVASLWAAGKFGYCLWKN